VEEEHLLTCPKCGALMFKEGYLRYGWYLDGKRVERCPQETPSPAGEGEGSGPPSGRRRRAGKPSPPQARGEAPQRRSRRMRARSSR
jgi:hypothetical protein